MDSLLSALNALNPFLDGTTEEKGRELLIKTRTFPFAGDGYIACAARAIKSYVLAFSPLNEESWKVRVDLVLPTILNTQTMKLRNSRVLAYIVKQAKEELSSLSPKLGAYFLRKVVGSAWETFHALWNDAFKISANIERYNTLTDIPKLRFITAFVGDLNSTGLVQEFEFVGAVNTLLRRIQGPLHFTLFMCDFLARALTNEGRKLSATKWKEIASRWNAISCKGPINSIHVAISLFYHDATRSGSHCEVNWGADVSGDMLSLCDTLVSEIGRRMSAEEADWTHVEGEEDDLANVFGAIQL
ncbi:hypothetical protein NMY22_g5894 [Coprinellus aureogranulatus]|nr:hypothetical protein NMY22_g5894 [Coprinellus aureogranulatus]